MSDDGLYKPTQKDVASALGAAPAGTPEGVEAAARKEKSGRGYLLIILAGFALVIAVNIGMVVVALDSFSGLETEDHYRKGIKYNDNVAAAKAQAEMGWQMSYEFDLVGQSEQTREGNVRVSFADRNGQPMTDLDVEVVYVRPVESGFDQTLTLTHREQGIYAGTVKLPKAGQWDMRVHAWQGDKAFQESHRVQIP